MAEKFVNCKFKIISDHLAVACLKTRFQHIPEKTNKNIRIVIIPRFIHIAILQTEILASVLLPSHVLYTVLITQYVARVRLVILGLINIILPNSTHFFSFPNGAANWHKGRLVVWCHVTQPHSWWMRPTRKHKVVTLSFVTSWFPH